MEEVSLDDIVKASRDAEVYQNIMEFRDRFETLLGERGVTLSGGQKQRVSIARALIRSPRILIFDDCLSAVDTDTEERILNNLWDHMAGKTALIVSHRVSSVKNADRIIVLDEGKVIESGSHRSLLSQNGVYAEMHRKQLLEGKVEE